MIWVNIIIQGILVGARVALLQKRTNDPSALKPVVTSWVMTP